MAVIVYDWLSPWNLVVGPRGEMVPPVRASEVIMYFPVKVPVIAISPVMVTDVFLFVELNPAPGSPK